MTTPTSQIVEQAIAKTEAEEAGIVVDDPKNPKGGADDKATPKDSAKDDGTGKPAVGEDGKPAGDKDVDTPKYDKDGKRIEAPAADDKDKPELDKDGKPIEKKEGEFTADDAEEVDVPTPDKPAAPTDNAGIQLSPAESKYIADNIGEPIVLRGIRGEGENAKEVEIKAYSPNDIPADFKFANDQQMLAANNGFMNLEQKANQLLGNFRQTQGQQAAQEFEQRENEGIRADVADLQKDGLFPKFTVKPGTAGFDDSPEAKQMAEVLNVMTERNETYLKQYNQGRPYKHIGFAEAFELWRAKNPASQAAAKADEDQKAEDAERRRTAERGDSNRGMNTGNIVKPTVRPGTTMRDIMARIDADDSY
jgi:hypothetical protein